MPPRPLSATDYAGLLHWFIYFLLRHCIFSWYIIVITFLHYIIFSDTHYADYRTDYVIDCWLFDISYCRYWYQLTHFDITPLLRLAIEDAAFLSAIAIIGIAFHGVSCERGLEYMFSRHFSFQAIAGWLCIFSAGSWLAEAASFRLSAAFLRQPAPRQLTPPASSPSLAIASLFSLSWCQLADSH